MGGSSSSQAESVSSVIAQSIHHTILNVVQKKTNNTISQALISITHAKYVDIKHVNVENELQLIKENIEKLTWNERFANQLADNAFQDLHSKQSGLAGVISKDVMKARSELTGILMQKETINRIRDIITNSVTKAVLKIDHSTHVKLDHVNIKIQMQIAMRSIESEIRTSAHMQKLTTLTNLLDRQEKSGLGDTFSNMWSNLMTTVRSIGLGWILIIGAIIVGVILFLPMLIRAFTGGALFLASQVIEGGKYIHKLCWNNIIS